MIFADDMNSYFGGPQHNSASTNPLDMPGAPWKPPGAGHSADLIPGSGYNDGSGSKLVTKWGHPMPVDYQKNGGHHESQQILNQQAAPFTPGLHHGAQPGFPTWNEPSFQFTHQPPQQDQHLQQTEAKFSGLNLKANVFHPSMPPQQGPPGHFTPPVEMVNGQWGRAEINQTTPWNLEMNGISANESTQSQQQPQQRYRKWEQQPRDVDGPFNPGGYPGPAPYGMHGYGSGNDRIMPGGGGAFAPPQFAPPNRVPPQRWDGGMGGPPSGKFGGGDMGGAGVNMMQQQRGSGGPTGLFTSGPPPPLHSMGMPPRPGHILGGHMPPPPLLPSLNPHTMGGAQFNNQFVQMDIQPSNLSEDSVWQDPNGDLRKWQKDTGTSIWGDPAKQTNVPIQRWLQFTADEVVAKSSILSKDGEIVDGGWGDLPPIGANAALVNNNSSNTGNPNSNSGARSGGGNQFIMPHHSQSSSQPQPQQHPNKNNRQIGSNSNSNSWGQENQISGAQAWERHEQQQQQNIPMHQQNMNPLANSNSQFQPPSGAMSTGSTAGNFMLPPTTTAAQSQQQQSMFQPPSLLSSLIDPMTGTSETDHHQQGGQGGQRKTASPPGPSSSTMGLGPPPQQAPQQTKVSLAEELSSLGGTHGLGGPIW